MAAATASGWFKPRCAELESRYPAFRVQTRVRQQVRRRLAEGKRQEGDALRQARILARRALQRATPRRHADPATRSDSEPPEIGRRQRDRRRGLQRIKHADATGHRAGMPMLELASSGEDKGIIRVRYLRRIGWAGGNQPGTPVRGRELIVEDDIHARRIRRRLP